MRGSTRRGLKGTESSCGDTWRLCVCRLHAAWGVTICRSILPFARGCRVGVWFGFVRAALLPAVGTCVVLAFGAMPGRCCFLRVTQGGLDCNILHSNHIITPNTAFGLVSLSPH